MFDSISTINADIVHTEFGARGQGIVWAVVGTGVDASHPHFKTYRNLDLPEGLSHWDFSGVRAKARRLVEKKNRYVEQEALPLGRRVKVAVDAHGHGTSVAAIIAGESQADDDRRLRGMAPECKLLGINIADEAGKIEEFDVLWALRALQEMNAKSAGDLVVHGVTIPLQMNWSKQSFACGYSPICVEVDRLVNSGVVVVVAAGDTGFDNERNQAVGSSIQDPGNAPNAITVGATHRSAPMEYGASYFSARGPTADGRLKPDLLAPGEKITTCLAGKLADGREGVTGRRDGTVYAAAHVSGAIAALLSAQRELIGRPLEVKDLLLRTAVDLRREKAFQGAGLVDVAAALRSARQASGQTGAAGKRRPVRVFISYAHQDVSLWLEFKGHLSPMERTGLIEVWSDREMRAGQWEPQIDQNLESADVVLLFVSSFFVQSDYCYSKEMKRALERQQAGKARVIPIFVRPVVIKDTPIAALQMLPSEKQAVTDFKDPHQGWAEVAAKLRETVMELRSS
jgi:subtilisin family serine protease